MFPEEMSILFQRLFWHRQRFGIEKAVCYCLLLTRQTLLGYGKYRETIRIYHSSQCFGCRSGWGFDIRIASLARAGEFTDRTLFATALPAKALSDACAEEALAEVRNLTSFTGSGSLTIGQGTCSYSVTSQGGQDRTVAATGTVGTIVRKTKVVLNKITPSIAVVSWQEVGDF